MVSMDLINSILSLAVMIIFLYLGNRIDFRLLSQVCSQSFDRHRNRLFSLLVNLPCSLAMHQHLVHLYNLL